MLSRQCHKVALGVFLIAGLLATSPAQSPLPRIADPGPLVLDSATGLSIPVGWRVTPLFSTSPGVPTPESIALSPTGDIYLTGLSGSACGVLNTTHVYRVPMTGDAPTLPLQITQFTNTSIPGHLLEVLPTGELIVGGTCSQTQFIYTVDLVGNVTTLNPGNPLNDPDGFGLGTFPGTSIPALYVATQDELQVFNVANLAAPVLATVPVDLTGTGLTALGNWGRVLYDPNTQTLLATYAGVPMPGVSRTIEIDIQSPAALPPVSIIGPNSLEPLLVDERGIRIFGDGAGRLGMLDSSVNPPVVRPILDGLSGRGRIANAGNGSFFVLDRQAAMVYRLDPSLRANTLSLSRAAGGTIVLTLEAPDNRVNEPFLMLTTLSGANPGVPLSPTLQVPINPDLLTDFALLNITSPIFSNWTGLVDGAGMASAALTVPPGLVNVDITLHFAYLLGFNTISSNATWVHLVP